MAPKRRAARQGGRGRAAPNPAAAAAAAAAPPRRARRRQAIPTYVVNVEQALGLPHVVTVRPQVEPGAHYDEARVAGLLAAQIRASVIDAVRAAGVNPRRVRGFLQALNLDNGGNHTHDDVVTLTALNGQQIMDIVARLQQSNEDLFIFDVEWRFTIDPGSIRLGGARDAHLPSFKTSKDMDKTWVKIPLSIFFADTRLGTPYLDKSS